MIACRACGAKKPIDQFYRGSVRKDASSGECKECTKARVRKRARVNPLVQEYDRERAKLPHRRQNAARVVSMWRGRNPLGYAAHTAVSNAVRDGKLQKEPCLFCGAENVHAHHKDYAKPLDVIWLCPKCHHRLHAAFPEVDGANKAGQP